MSKDKNPKHRGVQSVEVSIKLLTVLADHNGPMLLSDLAIAADMAPAKVHRYLASFVATGMVTHRHSGSYDLGPLAARVGIAAVARIDPVNRAADALPALVDATGYSAMLSVWGNAQPTVVRWEKSAQPLVTTLGLGSVLSPTRSATGLAFLAHLPDRLTDPVLAKETKAARTAIEAIFKEVRATGVAQADQTFIPGLHALARPFMDLQGTPVAVITLVSTSPDLLDLANPARAHLLRFDHKA